MRCALGLLSVFLVACGGSETKAAPTKEKPADRKVADKVEPKGPAKPEPFVAKPTAEPPAPPAGALAVPEPWRYVQICNEDVPCPDLLQTEGELHCRDLKIGNLHSGWRLPSKSEMGRWASTAGLKQLDGYHWTRTPFEEDPMQVWIVDPSGKAQETTIPRKRKPFRVRCVYEP